MSASPEEISSASKARIENYRKYWDQRMAQQIRENSQELRELESRIRAAYVTKSLSAQLAEKERQRLEMKLQEERDIKLIEQQRQIDEAQELVARREHRIKQAQLLADLQEQIVDKRRKRKRLYEEFLKEKLIIDEIIRQVQKEQIEEMQERLLKSMCLREEMDRLRQEQNRWKVEQERLVAEENERITAYIAEQDEKMRQIQKNLKAKQKSQFEKQERMCAQLNEIEKQKLEREELLIELKCQELHEKQLLRDRVELERRIRLRLQNNAQLDEQMCDIRMRKLEQEKEENEFRTQQLQALAERDRIELMSNERRRMKVLEHHRAVREMIAEREAQRNADIFDMLQEHENYMALERRRQEIFERERWNILRKHADELIGFLPQGMLKDYKAHSETDDFH